MLLNQKLYQFCTILLVYMQSSSKKTFLQKFFKVKILFEQINKGCQNPCLNGGVLVIRPSASIVQVCICQKNFIGKTCETRIDSLSATDKLRYGCELRPCFIGSTCEDRPDGNFVCHCAAVSILLRLIKTKFICIDVILNSIIIL